MNLLPPDWVDSLFARLLVTYGRPFLAQYEGLDENAIKADWAKKLGGFQRQQPDGSIEVPALAWALETLPVKPPSLLGFCELCRSWRESDAPLGLPAPPRAVPESVRRLLQELRAPREDKRPEKIRIAARYVAMFGTPGMKLNPFRAATLKEMRGCLADYEAQQVQIPKLQAEDALNADSEQLRQRAVA